MLEKSRIRKVSGVIRLTTAPIRKRQVKSVKEELLKKSQEAALTAVKVFNDPLIYFKSETYVVLMVIAWTYLLHAFYRSINVDYRYYNKGSLRKKYDRTKHGAYKYWELERCLNDNKCPVEKGAMINLKFLIGLRHEIEHQMTSNLDNFLSGRYQACVVNYNDCIKKLFGDKYGIEEHLTYSLQFLEITEEQISGPRPEVEIPERLRAFIVEFDGSLTQEEYESSEYSYRLLFTKRLANRLGQADKVIEFIDPKSELAKTIDREYWVQKQIEKPKYRATDVVSEVQKAGFQKFRIQPEHLNMWKSQDAKNPSKGFGVDVQGAWYWYENWIKQCIELCEKAGDKFR